MDYKIEVLIDGKCIPAPSYAKLQEILRYVGDCEEAKERLDAYVESEAVKPSGVTVSASEAPAGTTAAPEGNTAPSKPASVYGFSTPPGQQAGDYAKRILEDTKQGLKIDALTEAMLTAGWKTNTATPETQRRAVSAALNRAKDLFAKRDGLWELVAWQSNNLLE